jgi:hypothetical protein
MAGFVLVRGVGPVRRASRKPPLSAPNPPAAEDSPWAADLVWDPPPDPRLRGYEIRWRQVGDRGWRAERIPPARHWRVSPLQNDQPYQFQLRSLAGSTTSAWTDAAEVVPGATEAALPLSFIPAGSWKSLGHMVTYSLAHTIRTSISRARREHR